MDNITKIAAIKAFQESCIIHPLTCDNDSNHELLEGIEQDGEVILKCPSCDYTQQYIPQGIYEGYVNGGIKQAMENWKDFVEPIGTSDWEDRINKIKWYDANGK